MGNAKTVLEEATSAWRSVEGSKIPAALFARAAFATIGVFEIFGKLLQGFQQVRRDLQRS